MKLQGSPRLVEEMLIYEQHGQEQSLRVGTPEWYLWLTTASLFTVTDSSGTFTARKERAGSKRGGWYWKLYSRQNGKLCSAYLGKAEALTLERVTTVMQRLIGDRPGTHRGKEEQRMSHPSTQAREKTSAPLTFLPLPLTPLIGREQEVLDLKSTLGQQEKRLVTVTGTGGVGKTHLALTVARDLLPVFADGVAFLSLEAITNSDLVLLTLASALGIPVREQHFLPTSLVPFFQAKHMLLVLDNFEQVVEAAPQIASLIMACPQLSVLTTSRMALHVHGEQTFPLLPLALADPVGSDTPETLLGSPAIALFVRQAQAHVPSFQLTRENGPTVAAICRQLDGLPLALELAAARLPLFSPQAILMRLSQRLSLLTIGLQSAPTRQQTLRNTLDWSYSLLNGHEQQVLRLLSVFVGGCTIQAIETVARATGIQAHSVLESLASLLDQHLIQQSEPVGPEPRLRLLETVREYASSLLNADEHERQGAHDAHASFYLTLAEETSARFGDAFHLLLPALGPEHDNLRAALHWFLEHSKMNEATRLASALEWFWAGGGSWSEGLLWFEQILVQPHAVSTRELARALTVAGKLAQLQGNYSQASRWGRESLALFRHLGERRDIITALTHLAYTEMEQGVYERAITLVEEADVLEQQAGRDTRSLRCTLLRVLTFAGEYDRAKRLAEEVQFESQSFVNQTEGIAAVHYVYGWIALIHHDLHAARVHLEAACNGYRTVGFVRLMLETQAALGFVTLQEGALGKARAQYQELAQQCLSQAGYSPQVLALALRGLGLIAAKLGHGVIAVRLWGGAARLNPIVWSYQQDVYHAQVSAVSRLFDEAIFALLWKQGERLAPEALLAMQEQGEPSASLPVVPLPRTVSPLAAVAHQVVPRWQDALTTREGEVLRLLAEGKTNRQIAEQLVISPRTVNTHLTSLYQKLRVTSRTAATRVAIENGWL
jgi:predicted ATPase/DNA-binding CsgD family transcriptional regulator